MFTGIVEQTGKVTEANWQDGNLKVTVTPQKMWSDLSLGESIACNGACLTVVGWDDHSFAVELSQESVNKTASLWKLQDTVNLERAMPANGRFGGHVVTGHVDGVGEILQVEAQPGAYTIKVSVPDEFARYLIPKGSITVNGVSLTVVDVGGPAGSKADLQTNEFTLWIIPHTLEVTSLKGIKAGDLVNLEYDVLAKYLERLTLVGGAK
ncbi:riboflavin synthase [Deinococcus roseus]|uniref:Riboflavin synthase n=1 Tax=Deinococcus roseus TaxID=392414 RepID=A0ABQ2CTB6_9DEIO|nr:riboflavin synthase [Deinococcus roseus]GGJ18782.1 riboflavin synthase subunit alpha [Deinococcus roseus]